MFNFETLTVNSGDMIMAYIKEDKIFDTTGKLIGRTEESYQTVLTSAKECEELLYTNNIWTRPKTPEQLNQELQEQIKAQSELMASMTDVISGLKDDINNMKKEKKDDAKKDSRNNVAKSNETKSSTVG